MDLQRRIVRAKMFIDDHYDRPLDLDKLSDEACFSKFHFLRLFKRTYNRTPHQYLSERRIEIAKEKLKSEARVHDVCIDVGFESLTSFSHKFKEYTGQTPAVYRLRALELKLLGEKEPQRFIPSCFSDMRT